MRDRQRLPEIFRGVRLRLRHQFVGPVQQFGGAALAHRDRGDDGHAERLRQARHIHGDAAAARDVEHVEHQHQRPAGALELQQETDRQPQIGGIRDAEH